MLEWDAIARALESPRAIELGIGLIFGWLALDRFSLVLQDFVNEPTPQAKGMGVTGSMVARADLTVLTYSFFLFYGTISALYRLPGGSIENLFIDAVINSFFLFAIMFLVGRNVGELIIRGTFTIRRALYLMRLVGERGVDYRSLGLIIVAFIFKYELQGWPVIEKISSLAS